MEAQKRDLSEGESNILVAIRVRPLSQKEINSGDWDVIRIQDNMIVCYSRFHIDHFGPH